MGVAFFGPVKIEYRGASRERKKFVGVGRSTPTNFYTPVPNSGNALLGREKREIAAWVRTI